MGHRAYEDTGTPAAGQGRCGPVKVGRLGRISTASSVLTLVVERFVLTLVVERFMLHHQGQH